MRRLPARFDLLAMVLGVFTTVGAEATETLPASGGRVPLSGHVLPLLAQARRLPAAPAATARTIPVTVVLQRTDPAGFQALLKDLYDPDSPRFRQFPTSTQLRDRFGPSQADYQAVLDYFRQQGFLLAEGSENRLTLTLHGTRAQVQQALAVRIADFQLEGRSFFANETEPSLPAHLAPKVQAIAGLSDLGQPRATPQGADVALSLCILGLVVSFFAIVVYGPLALAVYFAIVAGCLVGIQASSGARDSGRGQSVDFLNNPYNPPLLRSSGSPGTPDGTGQTIGLVQFDTFHPDDVADYLALLGAPESRLGRLSQQDVNGGVPVAGNGETEVLLDIDVTMNIAPGANIVVYEAPLAASWQTMFNAILNDDVTIISNSWSSCENEHSLADVQSIETILQTAAAAGVSVFNASGDTGSTCLNGSPNTVGVPASSPSGTAVGGTSMQGGAGYLYGSETWWRDQGGFGVSRHFPRPAYQDGITGASMRSVPDVAILADPMNGVLICQASRGGCPTGLIYGGTSMSAPIFAAYAAILNDSRGQNLGAFNPALYPLAGEGAFHTAASMNSDFAHVGLGSPNLDVLDRLLADQPLGLPDGGRSQVFQASALIGQFQLPPIVQIPADGVAQAVVCVILRDDRGHTIGGQSVSLAANGNADVTITPATAVTTEANGAATFRVSSLEPGTVSFTATRTASGTALPQTASVVFGVPPAASGGIAAFPETAPANGSTSVTVTITLRDALDRPSPGKRISIAQGSGHAVITGPTPQETDASGQIAFTVTDGVAETVTFTAVNETDQVPIPGSATVTFSGTTTSCVGQPPTAAEGYALTPFVNGFPAADFFYSNISWGGCPGITNPVFASDGSVLMTYFPEGRLLRFGAGGGSAPSAQLLATLGPTFSNLTFGPHGELYGAHGATGNGFSSGDIVQLDPATGAVLRTVAQNLTCPYFTIDPLSGDLFYDNTCFGSPENPSVWRISDPNSATPEVTVYATLPSAPGGVLSFAPDGTLFAAYDYNVATAGLVQISGTDQPGPPTVTPLSGLKTIYWVRVAEVDDQGAARSLLVLGDPGLQLVDITTGPYTVTQLTNGPMSSGTIGPDGCLYTSASDTIFKLGPADGDCGFLPSNPSPLLTLSPSAVTPDPMLGTQQTFTATFRNVSVPENTLVTFRVLGPNTQPKVARTDANGVASIAYTGLRPGTDRVSASAVAGDGGPTLISNTVSVRWDAPPVAALGLLGGLLTAGLILKRRLTRRRAPG